MASSLPHCAAWAQLLFVTKPQFHVCKAQSMTTSVASPLLPAHLLLLSSLLRLLLLSHFPPAISTTSAAACATLY